MRDGLRLVQQALLEADVSFPVAKEFMGRVTDQADNSLIVLQLQLQSRSSPDNDPGPKVGPRDRTVM